MSLDLRSVYGIQVLSGQPGYPYGKARNVTVSGDGTGTPWEAGLVNDFIGFHQALLTEAGIVPSGTPDKVGTSDYLDAVKYLTRNVTGGIVVSGGSITVIGVGNGIIADEVLCSGGIFVSAGNALIAPTTFSKPATFEDVTTFQHQITVSLGGIVVGGGFVGIGNGLDGIIIQQGGLTVLNGAFDITPSATFHDEIVLADAARIRERVVYGTDSDSTYSIVTADMIVARSGVVSAARIYKLDNAGASLGSHIDIVNYSPFALTIQNLSGGTRATCPAVSGGVPGRVKMAWVDDGTGTQWSRVA